MKVVLLGAGASKAYGASPSGLRMPVARDFFQIYEALPSSSNPWVLIHSIIGYLRFVRGITNPLDYLRSGIDVEQLHSEIEEDTLKPAEEHNSVQKSWCYSAYIQMSFLFSFVINEIQNGPVSEAHINLVRMLSSEDAIITFNWDTLADRALARETDWRPDWGYGVKPHRVFRNEWQPPTAAPERHQHPALLKLHGSTNWITAYAIYEGGALVLTHDLSPETLHVVEFADRPYPAFAGRYMAGYQPFAYGYYPPNLLEVPGRPAPEGYKIAQIRMKFPGMTGASEESGLASMPLIIPPVKKKNYNMFGTLFSTMWKEAEDYLVKADEIAIIVYSFPRTDLQSEELFVRAFMRRSNIPRILIIDPVPERIVDKFALVFGVPRDRITFDTAYFSESYDLRAILGW